MSFMKEDSQHGVDLSGMEPNSPDAFTLARHTTKAMVQKLESQFKAQQASTYKKRLEEEFERLVRSFAGSDGADPEKWKALLRKLELMASRQIQRQDSLALQEYVGQR